MCDCVSNINNSWLIVCSLRVGCLRVAIFFPSIRIWFALFLFVSLPRTVSIAIDWMTHSKQNTLRRDTFYSICFLVNLCMFQYVNTLENKFVVFFFSFFFLFERNICKVLYSIGFHFRLKKNERQKWVILSSIRDNNVNKLSK